MVVKIEGFDSKGISHKIELFLMGIQCGKGKHAIETIQGVINAKATEVFDEAFCIGVTSKYVVESFSKVFMVVYLPIKDDVPPSIMAFHRLGTRLG